MAYVQSLFSWSRSWVSSLIQQKAGPEANDASVSKLCSPDVSVYSTLFSCFTVSLSVG